ncbi:unnamed protein product [Protopolystoma xenopodis]|uniref:Uncharacterized protein n=1 Tax=Protopolystoma xenopodis TaxID=117903 RepID=A0A448WLJ8_9PLAT|nr:unnamed protein product [Protopolystoma xenopodis]
MQSNPFSPAGRRKPSRFGQAVICRVCGHFGHSRTTKFMRKQRAFPSPNRLAQPNVHGQADQKVAKSANVAFLHKLEAIPSTRHSLLVAFNSKLKRMA